MKLEDYEHWDISIGPLVIKLSRMGNTSQIVLQSMGGGCIFDGEGNQFTFHPRGNIRLEYRLCMEDGNLLYAQYAVDREALLTFWDALGVPRVISNRIEWAESSAEPIDKRQKSHYNFAELNSRGAGQRPAEKYPYTWSG